VRYLLDTNVVSDLVRNPRGRTTDRIALVGEEHVGTSIIVAAESAQLERVLDALDVAPFAAPADTVYDGLRARLERSGRIIGANDLLIAAQALALGSTLVTDNQQEFSRVDGLPLENWLRD
jgi:tRNA(fMet)-specific endonuclease VapC